MNFLWERVMHYVLCLCQRLANRISTLNILQSNEKFEAQSFNPDWKPPKPPQPFARFNVKLILQTILT